MISHRSPACCSTLPSVLTRLAATVGLSVGAIALTSVAIGSPAAAQVGLLQTETAQAETAQTETAPASPASGVVAPPADPTPKPTPFAPQITGVIDLSTADDAVVGVGHLRPQTIEDLEGDAVSWLSSIILPLYSAPGGDHWGWIYQGWLIPAGQTYLAIGRDAGFAMVAAYENAYTFPVLETRDDGWFRVQYTSGGSAWAHTSQLALGETPLVLESWEDRLTSQAAVYFLEAEEGQPLRSRPEPANNMLGLVPADSLIEPLDFAGDWMRVRVTRPVAECTPLTGATVTEGWMRWRNENREPLIGYRADGGCQSTAAVSQGR